jgi:hypothetical protein
LITLLGFAWIIRADVHLGYPWAYFRSHRTDFAKVAEFAQRVAVGDPGYTEVRIPPGYGQLSGETSDIGRAPDGRRNAMVWVEYASGFGYGYAYAPSARRGQALIPARTEGIVTVAALGGGWWWAAIR